MNSRVLFKSDFFRFDLGNVVQNFEKSNNSFVLVDFDVSSQEVAEMRVRQLKLAVVRNGTNLLPGFEIPQDELSFRQVLEGFPLTRKINVCFSSLQEVEDDLI